MARVALRLRVVRAVPRLPALVQAAQLASAARLRVLVQPAQRVAARQVLAELRLALAVLPLPEAVLPREPAARRTRAARPPAMQAAPVA
jgi:hypothetical protein